MAENEKAPESTTKAPVSATSKAEAKEVKASGKGAFNHDKNGQSGRGDRQGRGNRDGKRPFKREQDPYQDQVVAINKIAKVEKGGKHIRFAALVIIGDGKGKFGFGQGKSAEVPVAIKKSLEYAHSNITMLPMTKEKTIPHEIRGKCGVCEVYLKPAPAGTGIIAGGAVRAIMQLAGVKNIYSKVYGRRTSINVVRATIDAISKLKTKEYVEKTRLGIVPSNVKPVKVEPKKEETK